MEDTERTALLARFAEIVSEDPAGAAACLTEAFPPWRVYLSVRTKPSDGPPRAWAARALPTQPCEPVCTNPGHTIQNAHGDCGITEDKDTLTEMAAFLAADLKARLAA